MKSLRVLAVFLCAFLCAPANADKARDFRQEDANRALVVGFYEQVFNKHDAAGGALVMTDDYLQHNPMIESGKKAFVAFFTDLHRKNPQARARILRVAADGDLVWIHAHHTVNPSDPGMVLVDIFRVDKGKIAEHWDVMQKYPEKALNAMF